MVDDVVAPGMTDKTEAGRDGRLVSGRDVFSSWTRFMNFHAYSVIGRLRVGSGRWPGVREDHGPDLIARADGRADRRSSARGLTRLALSVGSVGDVAVETLRAATVRGAYPLDVSSLDLLLEIVYGDAGLLRRVERRYYDMTGRGMYDAWTTARCLAGTDGYLTSSSRMYDDRFPVHHRCVLDAGHAEGHVF